MYHDRFTGKYHTHYRQYDPLHNRWLSEDPAGYKDGLNLYAAYMGPNGYDPLGLATVAGVKKALAIDEEFMNYYTMALQKGIVVEFKDIIRRKSTTWWERFIYGYTGVRANAPKWTDEAHLNYLDVAARFKITGNSYVSFYPWSKDKDVAGNIKLGIMEKVGAIDDGFQIYDLAFDAKEFDKVAAKLVSGDYLGAGSSALKIGGQLSAIAGGAVKVFTLAGKTNTLVRAWSGTKYLDDIALNTADDVGAFGSLEGGGSWLMTKKQYDQFVKGQPLIGRSDGQFILSSADMNRLIAETGGDAKKLAKILGTEWKSNDRLIRMDVLNPLGSNPRFPATGMSGTNSKFIIGGKTVGGVSEYVIDPVDAIRVWSTPLK